MISYKIVHRKRIESCFNNIPETARHLIGNYYLVSHSDARKIKEEQNKFRNLIDGCLEEAEKARKRTSYIR